MSFTRAFINPVIFATFKSTADGVQHDFSVPFPYLNEQTVSISVEDSAGNVLPGYTRDFLNPSTVTVIPTPPAGSVVWVYRDSTFEGPLVTFTDTSTITEDDLNTAYLQAYYTAQEALDSFTYNGLAVGPLAAALATVAAESTSATASATAAATSATNAAVSAALALVYQNNAAVSASAAAASAVSAGADASSAVAGCLQVSNNLSDLNNVATARTNLGLAYSTLLLAANNLSDVANVATARHSLGLDTGDSPTFSTLSASVAFAFPSTGVQMQLRPAASGSGFNVYGDATTALFIRSSAVDFASNGTLRWTSGSNNPTTTLDLVLQRGAAGVLEQRNGVNAQTFRLYNTYTDASNYERGSVGFVSNNLQISTEKLGTGLARSIALVATNNITFQAGSFNSWQMNAAAGDLLSLVDNGYNIGGASNRIKNLFFGTQALGPDGSNTAPAFSFGSQVGMGLFRNGTNILDVATSSGFTNFSFKSSDFQLRSTGQVAFSSTTAADGAADLMITRDAGNVLAQRNGVTGQTTRIYNTYTDASNYERLSIQWSSNDANIFTENAGTGVTRPLKLGVGSAVLWQISTAGAFTPLGDAVFDIGTAALRPNNVYTKTLEVNQEHEAAVAAAGYASSTVTIDCSAANTHTVTPGASGTITTWVLNNIPASGKRYTMRVIIIGGTLAAAISFPASFNWGNNTAPTTTTANKETHIDVWTRDGGTHWLAAPRGVY